MNFLKSWKWQNLVFEAGAALFCLEPEPTHFVRIRLRDLGLPEPPKEVAAPQHCLKHMSSPHKREVGIQDYQSRYFSR